MKTTDEDFAAPEMPLAFDDSGHPINVTHPVYETQDEDTQDEPTGKLTLPDVFDLLLYGASSDRDIAGRVSILGYLLKSERAPKNLDELGLRLGISKQAAHKRLTTFRRNCAEILTF